MKLHYIDGTWSEGEGEAQVGSSDSATGAVLCRGAQASAQQVAAAVAAARMAFPSWSRTPLPEREGLLRGFAERLQTRVEQIATAISGEVGKPLWESKTEVASMAAKASVSIEAYRRRCSEFSAGAAVTRFRPHGVAAVLGPFNFPGHLPNGHIMPALLAGNTVVFKPSEHAPETARRMAVLWEEAGLPPGVLNVVQGGRAMGETLAGEEIDALYFTGSSAVGLALRERFARRPGTILALEMGGNNPLVVHKVSDLPAAAWLATQSAYATAGQRCSCARRLIVPEGREGDRFIEQLCRQIDRVRVGLWTERPEPFHGPVVSEEAARSLLAAQARMLEGGGRALREMARLRPDRPLLSPGLIDVTGAGREDGEIFGPLLQLVRVRDFEGALEEANRTAYGLAAGLLSDDPESYAAFLGEIRAGVINWNHALVGASSAAPFGGIKLSGNHRPGAFFAADYCSYPVASLESLHPQRPGRPPPGLEIE